ncbi:WD repeat-containing protein 97 [Pangasianodon hypophthalmus]|uniref:WD repeat-containing protein 97 n=1 Tax=Pangasianodon hypophthalmus TaxID=310915 RepID=UPI002307583E|nr:WD repeat-containing protein 97 [Pangasianodon hypophthalmus]
MYLLETSPKAPPPPVTPPPEEPLPEKPKFTQKRLRPLPPIKPTPPPAPPPPVRTPQLPDFLKQFLHEEWFHTMYPDPGCIPESLSLTEFFAQLLDFLKHCVVNQKLCVLKAIITLHKQNSLNTHTITHGLLDSLHACLHKDMSDMEQRFVVELLHFLVCVNPHSYDVTVEILVLLADKELRLEDVAVCMLQALGVDDAPQWLRPQAESWDREAQKHAEPRRCLRELAHHWLNSWTAKYRIHKSAGKKSALSSLVITPSEVLRFFCWVQKEAQVQPPADSSRKDTVRLDTHTYRWQAVHRLGEMNTMMRVREPQGLWLPPLTSRPLLTGFTRLLSLPLPRVTSSSLPLSLEAHCLKQAPLQRYFLLERSYVQFYR